MVKSSKKEDSDEDSSSYNKIALIVCLVFVFALVFVSLCIWYFLRLYKKKLKRSQTVTPSTDTPYIQDIKESDSNIFISNEENEHNATLDPIMENSHIFLVGNLGQLENQKTLNEDKVVKNKSVEYQAEKHEDIKEETIYTIQVEPARENIRELPISTNTKEINSINNENIRQNKLEVNERLHRIEEEESNMSRENPLESENAKKNESEMNLRYIYIYIYICVCRITKNTKKETDLVVENIEEI